jgi:predicted RNA-binding Zn ribbon-like protein
MPMVAKKGDDFLWVGNTPSLDFVNTEIVQNGQIVDLLAGPEDFQAWLRYAGFSLQAQPDEVRRLEAGLRLARQFRTILRKGLARLAKTRSLPVEVIAASNEYLERAVERLKLVKRPQGAVLRPYWRIESAADYVAPIATSFARFIADADLSRVRKCRNPACILHFYDLSKSGTRAWCSLDICGNKMRMAAFRGRQGT